MVRFFSCIVFYNKFIPTTTILFVLLTITWNIIAMQFPGYRTSINKTKNRIATVEIQTITGNNMKKKKLLISYTLKLVASSTQF